MSKAITRFNIQVGGATVAGEQVGSGESVVFIHAGVADRRMWREQLAELSDRYHCVCYDTRGAGETTTPDEPFVYIDDLAAVLDVLEIESAHLVGCSNGGAIAVDFALRWPERVRSLVLIAPSIRGAVYGEISAELQPIVTRLQQANEAGDLEQVNAIEAHLWLDGPLAPEGRVSDPAVRSLFLEMNAIILRKYPKLTQQVNPPDAYDRLATLTMPTLVAIGEHDMDDLRELCVYVANVMPNAQLEHLAGCAHLPSMDAPERVNKMLRKFLMVVSD